MSRPFLFILLSAFCAGIAAGELWSLHFGWCIAACGLGVVMTAVRKIRLAALVVIGISLGLLRITTALSLAANDISRTIGQNVSLEGNIVLPSTIYDSSQQFELSDVFVDHASAGGKILVSVPAIPVVPTGSRLSFFCTMHALTETSSQRQWSHGIHARCSSTNVTVVMRDLKSWRATLGRWQESLLTYVRRHYNEPQASLLNGILIGNTDGMPDQLNQAFQATGTTHIVALSGFNVTIIMAIVVSWLIRLVGRRWAWIPALVLLIAFVVMSGASASVVRAAVMAVVVQAGLFLGRPISMGRLLAYTVLVMVWMNPLLLFHDLGFQLSFLATIGLVALSKPIAQKLSWVTELFGLRDGLATTLSAIVMTEPLLLWRFGRISLVAPLVNLIVVPLIPLAMAIGSMSLIGLLVPGIGALVVPLTDSVLRLIVWMISTGAGMRYSMVYLTPAVSMLGGALFTSFAISLSRHHVQEHHPA